MIKEINISEAKDKGDSSPQVRIHEEKSSEGALGRNVKDKRIDANLDSQGDVIPGIRETKQLGGASAGANLRHLPCDKEPCRSPELTREPKPDAGVRRAICEVGPCQVCPPGHYAGKNGVCAPNVAGPGPYPSPVDNDDYDVYPAQQPRLTEIDLLENSCLLFITQGEQLAAQLRVVKNEIENKCGQDIEPDCSIAQMRQQSKLLQYSDLLARAPLECLFFLPSYDSLQ